jgi:Flp pilus assembly protein protease CpaA
MKIKPCALALKSKAVALLIGTPITDIMTKTIANLFIFMIFLMPFIVISPFLSLD